MPKPKSARGSQTYKELQEKYKLLCDLMEHTPDVIYFKDLKGRLILVNHAHARGLGLKPNGVVGKTDFDIFPRERAQKMREDDLRVIRSGKPIIDKVERATRADGVDNYVSTTKIPRYDSKGEVIGLIGITRDITQRMQVSRLQEERLHIEKKLEALEELNKVKSEFISTVSHELRTPLSIIKQLVVLILSGVTGAVNPKQKEVLTKANNNIERLTNIIEELLDISRIETGKLKLHYSLVNLADLLKDSQEYFKKLAGEKNITLSYDLPRREINVFIDAERIFQVILNLINNAVKFTEASGKIQVELKVVETKVRIGIIDTGIGISKRDLPKIFDKFVQAVRMPTAEMKGIGLGLSIAKSLVERHGGEIWAESKLGVGSKFYFTLPRFYTVSLLEEGLRKRINELLAKGKPIYLINLLIINYEDFKKRANLGAARLFKDLEGVIDAALKRFCRQDKNHDRIILIDRQVGECSIIVPDISERKAYLLCRLLREKAKEYFVKNKMEYVFIASGMLPYPSGVALPAPSPQAPPDLKLNIKDIYIGQELRRFKRIAYKTAIEITLPNGKKEAAHTFDISQGGACFVGDRQLKTDSRIRVKIDLKGKIFSASGRIAWLKKMEHLPQEPGSKYKIGIEFLALKGKDKRLLLNFLKRV